MVEDALVPTPIADGALPDAIARWRFSIRGVVQGVGFRPFVFGLATRLGLTGFVGNDSNGVFIEAEGVATTLETFRQCLLADHPPQAHIEAIDVALIPRRRDAAFSIVASQSQPSHSTLISPDIATCDDCLRELCDPSDHRYCYPFINCTNCGPRFTITKEIPYDRPLTTMATFPMCPTCQAEYENPFDRRFHAQPNACAHCGPRVTFAWSPNQGLDHLKDLQPCITSAQIADQPIAVTQHLLAAGGIVAVKGLGGFHLACDARNQQAVQRLRARKGRVDKPFAVMARDTAAIEAVAHVNDHELDLLSSAARPIVLLRKKAGTDLSESVAPGNNSIGMMLPYTPLHHLLLTPLPATDDPDSCPTILVMTSGNRANEPIVKDNDAAIDTLSDLADAFLCHDRDIHVPCDDSVVRVQQGRELPIRRSRGYVPFPVKLPFPVKQTLAVGGELKSTFCLTKDNYAFMSQHIGDMANLETLNAFEHAVQHFTDIFRAQPEIIAADMHPRYLSARWAQAHCEDKQLSKVQHHHAHIAAVMAENGVDGTDAVIGFSFDGTGYGTDGAIWGGEVLLADYTQYQRVAHLAYVPLPGGDSAVRHPHRMALAYLWAAGVPWADALPPVAASSAAERRILRQQLTRRFNTVDTSSMGRLFDAVASLIGVRQTVTYEAQAAIELEALSDAVQAPCYGFGMPTTSVNGDAPLCFDAAPLIRAIVDDVKHGVPAGVVAAKFHAAVAKLIVELSMRIRHQHQHNTTALNAAKFNTIALSGGVFQNVTLLELAVDGLNARGFDVLTHRLVPPNDGGLALGQAIVASQI